MYFVKFLELCADTSQIMSVRDASVVWYTYRSGMWKVTYGGRDAQSESVQRVGQTKVSYL